MTMYQPKCPECDYPLEWNKEFHCWECDNCGLTTEEPGDEPIDNREELVN